MIEPGAADQQWPAGIALPSKSGRLTAAEGGLRPFSFVAGQPDLVHIAKLDLRASNSGTGKIMRCLFFCRAWLPALSMAQTSPDVFSREKSEKRFHAADKNEDRMLSRAEAYEEFPRAPKFFDEVDLDPGAPAAAEIVPNLLNKSF